VCLCVCLCARNSILPRIHDIDIGEVLVDGQVRKCQHVLKGGEMLTWRVRKGML
jgi:hypothetical protein